MRIVRQGRPGSWHLLYLRLDDLEGGTLPRRRGRVPRLHLAGAEHEEGSPPQRRGPRHQHSEEEDQVRALRRSTCPLSDDISFSEHRSIWSSISGSIDPLTLSLNEYLVPSRLKVGCIQLDAVPVLHIVNGHPGGYEQARQGSRAPVHPELPVRDPVFGGALGGLDLFKRDHRRQVDRHLWGRLLPIFNPFMSNAREGVQTDPETITVGRFNPLILALALDHTDVLHQRLEHWHGENKLGRSLDRDRDTEGDYVGTRAGVLFDAAGHRQRDQYH